MLTEKQVEVAAREFCRLMGTDPDERMPGADERHSTLAVVMPRWRFVARRVREEAAMLAAIETARASD
jgi:hypothetical protein